MKMLNSIEEINSFIKENRFALLYFSSKSCSVCVGLLPKIEELIKDYPLIKVGKIDVEKVPEVAGRFNIFTLPCISVLVDEKEAIREARFISISQLKDKIERYYNMAN